MPKLPQTIATVVVALMLASCDQSPGDAEVRQALKSAAGALGGAEFEKLLNDLKVIGCAKASPTGYKCDWTSSLGAGSGRIVNSEKGWVLVESGR